MPYWIDKFDKKINIKSSIAKTFKDKSIKKLVLDNYSAKYLQLNNCIIDQLIIYKTDWDKDSNTYLIELVIKNCKIGSIDIKPLIQRIYINNGDFPKDTLVNAYNVSINVSKNSLILGPNINALYIEKSDFPIIIPSKNCIQIISNWSDYPIRFEEPYSAYLQTVKRFYRILHENLYEFNEHIPDNIIPEGYIIRISQYFSYKTDFGKKPFFLKN
jgi:hypothetical protein